MLRLCLLCSCALVLWLVACSVQDSAQPVPAVTTQVLPSTLATATPDCQPVAGVSWKFERLADGTAVLRATGLQPGENPIVLYSTTTNGGSIESGEASDFAHAADAHGEFSFELSAVRLPPGQTQATWDVRLVHRRGVACARITLP